MLVLPEVQKILGNVQFQVQDNMSKQHMQNKISAHKYIYILIYTHQTYGNPPSFVQKTCTSIKVWINFQFKLQFSPYNFREKDLITFNIQNLLL